ncbi:MAG: sulfatase [Verrucomicrobia bacterium]|nr:sulfatase [Verrucomicrobiota bacterium]
MIKTIPALIAAFLCIFNAQPLAAKQKPLPDIVIFLTDDHSQLDSTPYGSKDFSTPNMQRLADAGLTFDQGFVASPSCAPSRAALLTGLMPARNGAEPNHGKPHPELKKWPAYFQELGYEVVAFGKVAHYKHTADYGFDYFAHDTFHDHGGIPAAVEFLKKRNNAKAKPLCLFVGSNWPHVPWPNENEGYDPEKLSLPAGTVDTAATREWRAKYAAAVTRGDNDLGLILDAAKTNLGKDTFFLFSSDHGTQWPFAKWNCYDAGIRVPLIVSWPGVTKPGTRTEAMVSWVDFLPTILEAAGGKSPKNIDGRSFLPVLRGKRKAHRDEIFTTHSGDGRWNIYPIRSVRNADWKYIRNLHPEYAFTTHIDLPGNLGQRAYYSTWENAAKTDKQAADIVKRYHARPEEELYDLKADPGEQRNLADDPRQASRLKKMRKEVEKWMREQNDQSTVYNEPRLLSDPNSYGPNAPSGNVAPKAAPKSGKPS